MSKNMKWTLGLLVVGCMLAMAAPAGADFTRMDSANFPSLYGQYNMVNTPDVEDLDSQYGGDFAILTGSGGTLNGTTDEDILTMITPVTGWAAYENCQADQTWQLDPNITYGSGYTYEVRLRIAAGTTSRGFAFLASTEESDVFAWLNVAHNGQSWDSGASVSLGSDNNAGDFHIFRVVQAPGETAYSVWRDGVLLNETAPLGAGLSVSGHNKIAISDNGSYWGGTVKIDYFRFTAGAFAPIPEPGTLVLLAGALLSLLVWRRR